MRRDADSVGIAGAGAECNDGRQVSLILRSSREAEQGFMGSLARGLGAAMRPRHAHGDPQPGRAAAPCTPASPLCRRLPLLPSSQRLVPLITERNRQCQGLQGQVDAEAVAAAACGMMKQTKYSTAAAAGSALRGDLLAGAQAVHGHGLGAGLGHDIVRGVQAAAPAHTVEDPVLVVHSAAGVAPLREGRGRSVSSGHATLKGPSNCGGTHSHADIPLPGTGAAAGSSAAEHRAPPPPSPLSSPPAPT